MSFGSEHEANFAIYQRRSAKQPKVDKVSTSALADKCWLTRGKLDCLVESAHKGVTIID